MPADESLLNALPELRDRTVIASGIAKSHAMTASALALPPDRKTCRRQLVQCAAIPALFREFGAATGRSSPRSLSRRNRHVEMDDAPPSRDVYVDLHGNLGRTARVQALLELAGGKVS
jgi:hypothetical protein